MVVIKMKTMKIFLSTIFVIAFSFLSFGQELNGEIVYNRKTDFISIMSRLPYLSEEQIDRAKLTWGNMDDNKGQDYLYYFNESKSLYTKKEEESEGNYSWSQEDFFLHRDHKKAQVKDLKETLGKKYLIEDDLPKYKWKILNEIKEIEGYLCMKAETYNEVKDQVIHAWFSDGIIFSGGPEGYHGLPGMILELDINEGDVVITATNIKLTNDPVNLPMPKKMKGKQLTIGEFDKIIEDYISDSIEAERNPYWRIRY